MDNLFETLRAVVITLFAAIATYLDPIQGSLVGILALLLVNFAVGFVTGLIVQDENFSFKKFVCACGEGAFFLGILSFTYFLGEHNGNARETVLCISGITYIIIYCYSINILKNVKRWLIKDSPFKMFINMLYYILTVEFLKKFPAFEKYKNKTEEQ